MGLAVRVTISLASAAALGLATSTEMPAQVATWEPEPARQYPFGLTIREIMRGPELVGQAPEDVRWTDDGTWLYFRWLPGASDSVTLTPATVFGVGEDYGSLEAGKVANLVVWSGDPFELSSRPVHVMIRGEFAPGSSRQRELFERYRELDAETPPAYR